MTNEALNGFRALWSAIVLLTNGVMAIDLFDALATRNTDVRSYIEMIIFVIEFLILTWLCWFS